MGSASFQRTSLRWEAELGRMLMAHLRNPNFLTCPNLSCRLGQEDSSGCLELCLGASLSPWAPGQLGPPRASAPTCSRP